jgi:hypothetical protein
MKNAAKNAVSVVAAKVEVVAAKVEVVEEEADVDMGNLFGDDY